MNSFKSLKNPLISDSDYANRLVWDEPEEDRQRDAKQDGSNQSEAANWGSIYQPPNSTQDPERYKVCTQEQPLQDYLKSQDAYVDPNLGSGESLNYETLPEYKQFYPRSTATHHIPQTRLLSFCQQRSNPRKFATFAQTSSLFDGQIEIKELINFSDYKRLEAIRVRNYVNLLKTITKIQPEMFKEVKIKIFQIKSLTEYLGLGYGNLFKQVYENRDKDVLDLEDDDEDSYLESEMNLEQDIDENYNDEDETQKYYDASSIPSTWERNFLQVLSREEEKWLKRAEFLEKFYDKICTQGSLQGWKNFFEAKLDELDSLDIPIKNIEPDKSSSVFYLFDYLEDYFKRQDDIKKNQGNTKNPDAYSRDEQIYFTKENLYPHIDRDINMVSNQGGSILKSIMNLREKLCLKIRRREADTDYILTVFERKSFGNEKIFEKRMNLRNIQNISVNRFELDPSDVYIYIQLYISPPNRSSFYLDLIFNAQAPNKVPIIIKNDSKYIGFNGDKFYSAKQTDFQYKVRVEDKEEMEKALKAKQDEESKRQAEEVKKEEDLLNASQENIDTTHHDAQSPVRGELTRKETSMAPKEITIEKIYKEVTETRKIYRLYEYNLHEIDQVRTYDLSHECYKDLSEEHFQTKQFGLFQYGYYYIRNILSEDKSKIEKQELYINHRLCKIDAIEGTKLDDKTKTQIKVNSRGQAVIVSVKKDDAFNVFHYQLDKLDWAKEKGRKVVKGEDDHKKDLKFTKTELVSIKAFIDKVEETPKTEWTHKFETLDTEFLILIQETKADKLTIFRNDVLVGSFIEHDYDRIVFNYEDNNIQSFYIPDGNKPDQVAKNNEIKFKYYEPSQDKKEWIKSTQQFEMLNQSTTVCFPYVMFLYNHDQVYMKDLTQPDNKGYYYMNGFMGIQQGKMRPLTLSAYVYNNKICLNIPIILTSYSQSEFVLRVHQIKTFQQSLHAFKFTGSIRYRMMAFNQELYKDFSVWSNFLIDPSNRILYNDIKIYFRRNCMHIEKWEKNRCTSRLIITQYHEPLGKDQFNIGTQQYVTYKQRSFWLVISQSGEHIYFYKREGRYNFRIGDFVGLEQFWEFNDDDQNNQVYQILVDTLPKNKIDIYFFYQNATMRKFSSIIPPYNSSSGSNGAAFTFEEHAHQISLEQAFQVKKIQQQQSTDSKEGGGAVASGKINLFENQITIDYFIANGILYSSKTIIDLNAQKFSGKNQVGVELNNNTYLRNFNNIVKMNYSFNEAKLAAFYQENGTNDLIMVLGPLVNTRVLPMFYHRQFRHPVAPILDRKRGFIATITMNLQTTTACSNWSYERMKVINYSNPGSFNNTPGILIKYFNGIEQKLPMLHQFIEVSRFVISKDGKNLTITGTRYNQCKKDNGTVEDEFITGMFVYELRLNEGEQCPTMVLIKKILFPKLDIQKLREHFLPQDSEKLEKMSKPAKNRQVKLSNKEKEILGIEVGEYEHDGFQFDQYATWDQYNSDLKPIDVNDVKFLQTKQTLMKELTDKITKFTNEHYSLESSKKSIEGELQTANTNLTDVNTKIQENNARVYQQPVIPEAPQMNQANFNPSINGNQINSHNNSTHLRPHDTQDLVTPQVAHVQTEEEFNAEKAKAAKDLDDKRNALEKKIEELQKLIADLEQKIAQNASDLEQQQRLKNIEEKKKWEIFCQRTPLFEESQEFKEFDILYYQGKNSYKYSFMSNWQNQLTLKWEPNEEVQNKYYNYEWEKKVEYFIDEDEQRTRTNNIMDNLHMIINESKDLFVLDRYNNKLYYFQYELNSVDRRLANNANEQSQDKTGEYILRTFKFETDFVIDSADSSNGKIVVNSKDRIVILKLGTDHHWVQQPKQDVDPKKKAQDEDLKLTRVIYDSNDKIQQDANKYSFQVLDVKMHNDKLIMKLKSDKEQIEYLRIMSISTKATTFYLENSCFLISGNKEYIWLVQENQVLDMERELSTFFLWPGDQISTHGYDSLDIFNVSEDRSMMTTCAGLQLAFNMISQRIDQLINEAFDSLENVPWLNVPNWFNYQCYKLSDYRTLLEKIFEKDYDKIPERKFYNMKEEEKKDDQAAKDQQQNQQNQPNNAVVAVKEEKNPKDELEKKQMKCLQNLLGFYTTMFNPDQITDTSMALFFSSYYFENKDVKERSIFSSDESVTFPNTHWNLFQKMFSIKEIRYELIEDILHYISSCKTCPILKSCINSCFIYFLDNASSSLAFQDYLNNVMTKTRQMTETEKFQFTTSDATYCVAAHDSPILDEKFYKNYQVITETKKDVDITYIEVGDLLAGEQGSKIMEKLADKNNLKLMDIPFIRYLVMYQWYLIRGQIMTRLLKPFIVLLVLFSIYSIYFITYTDISTETGDEDGSAIGPVKIVIAYSLYYLNMASLVIVLGYFFYQEGKQLIASPKDYIQSFWNMVDILNYTLCLLVLFFEAFSLDRSILRPTATLCFIVLWIKMFYFLRVFDSTAQLIRMIIEITVDMSNFLIVLVIGLIAFAGGLQILQYGLYTGVAETRADELFVGEDFFKAFIYTYRLALGDFQLDSFSTFEDDGLVVEYYLIWIIFIFGTMFLVIVLLNLLIAIMGDTFSKVLESIQNLTIREKVMLISENEPLFERSELFNNSQYLVIINEKQLEGGQAENWDGQINALKRQILDKVNRLETALMNGMSEVQKEMRKKFADQEDKSKKQTAATEQRFKAQNELAFAKIQEVLAVVTTLDTKYTKIDTAVVGLQANANTTGIITDQLSVLTRDIQKFAKVFYEKNGVPIEGELEDN